MDPIHRVAVLNCSVISSAHLHGLLLNAGLAVR